MIVIHILLSENQSQPSWTKNRPRNSVIAPNCPSACRRLQIRTRAISARTASLGSSQTRPTWHLGLISKSSTSYLLSFVGGVHHDDSVIPAWQRLPGTSTSPPTTSTTTRDPGPSGPVMNAGRSDEGLTIHPMAFLLCARSRHRVGLADDLWPWSLADKHRRVNFVDHGNDKQQQRPPATCDEPSRFHQPRVLAIPVSLTQRAVSPIEKNPLVCGLGKLPLAAVGPIGLPGSQYVVTLLLFSSRRSIDLEHSGLRRSTWKSTSGTRHVQSPMSPALTCVAKCGYPLSLLCMSW